MERLRMRKRMIRGDGGIDYMKVELQRMLCASQFTLPNMVHMSLDLASQFTLPNMVHMSLDLASHNRKTRSHTPSQASWTTDFTYQLISACILHIVLMFILHLSSPLQLYHHSGTPS
jgi:hypothetical protein